MLSRIDVRVWQAAFWCCWLTCTALFLLPAVDLPDVDVWDKAVHAAVFALLTALALLAYQHHHPRLTVASLLMLYGLVIECLQHFIPGRSFSLLDTVADAAGVLPVLLLATGWPRQRHQ